MSSGPGLMRVVVVGGGIGGLSAAIALRDAGHSVVVCERGSKLAGSGAGVSMWPNGAKALNALGVGAELSAIAPDVRSVEYRDKQGNLIGEIPLSPLIDAVGQRPYFLRRSDLHGALAARVDAASVLLDAACVDVRQQGQEVHAVLASGERISGDLLVGADGMRSVVRRFVAGAVPLRYISSIWLALVRRDDRLNPPDVFTIYAGDQRRVGVQPVSGERLYLFIEAPMSADVTGLGRGIGGMAGLFDCTWSPTVRQLLARVEAATRRTEIRDFDPLGTFVRGRVVLVGDAAHTMAPTLAQGAAQAVEDAVELARAVQGGVPVDDALRRYDAARRARTAPLVLAARARTETMIGPDTEATARWHERLRRGHTDFVQTLTRVALDGPLG
jgi:FAD-dependent urate hydroxylase